MSEISTRGWQQWSYLVRRLWGSFDELSSSEAEVGSSLLKAFVLRTKVTCSKVVIDNSTTPVSDKIAPPPLPPPSLKRLLLLGEWVWPLI